MADFSSLAQMARPQRPNIAASPIAGVMYGQQMGQYENFLANAAQEAKINAAIQAMKAGEFQAGHEGRMANIDLETETAKAKAEDFRSSGREDMARERMNKELKAAEPFLNAVAAAQDESEVTDILRNAGQYGNTKIRGKDLSQLSPAQVKKLADFYTRGQVETPAHRQKKEIEETKGEYKLLDRQFKEAGANTRQERMIYSRRELEKLKSKNPNAYSIAMEAANGDPIKALEFLAFLKVAPILQSGANTAGQANAILPPDKQMPTPSPVQGATPPTPSVQPESSAPTKSVQQFKVNTIYKDKQGNRAKYMGKDANGKDKWEPVK